MTGPDEYRGGRMAVELYAFHLQYGRFCVGCGESWPCPTRQAAPGHYRPGAPVRDVDAATEVIARHTELDGHCTACGEEWMCFTRQEARAVYQRESLSKPVW